MPFNGSAPNKTYSRTDGVRTGAAVCAQAEAALVNNTSPLADARENDLATAINSLWLRDGGNQPVADLPMNTHKFTGMSAGSARTDSVRLGQVQDGTVHYAEAGGTANAITLATTPTCSPVEGMVIGFVAEADSTGAVTVDLNTTGAVALQLGGSALVGGEINNGQFHEIGFDGTAWQLLNPMVVAGNFQPIDSDLTAIAALSTTSYGRSLLTQADAAAARSTLAVPGLTASENTFVFGTSTADADVVRWQPSDWGAGKPFISIKKNAIATIWTIGLWDGSGVGGTIDLNVTSLTHNGNDLLTTFDYADTNFVGGVVAIIQDQKTQNSNGGVSSTTDVARTLNVLTHNKNSAVSLAGGTTGVGGTANQFVLPAGTWRIDWRAPAYNSGAHRAIIHNVTDNVTVGIGSNGFSDQNATSDPSQSDSVGTCVVTIAGSKTFELRHSTRNSYGGSDGWGFGSNKGTEVFSQVVISAA